MRGHQQDPSVKANHSMADLEERIVVAVAAGTGSERWAAGIGSGRAVPSDCCCCMGHSGPAGPCRGRGTDPSCCAKV